MVFVTGLSMIATDDRFDTKLRGALVGRRITQAYDISHLKLTIGKQHHTRMMPAPFIERLQFQPGSSLVF